MGDNDLIGEMMINTEMMINHWITVCLSPSRLQVPKPFIQWEIHIETEKWKGLKLKEGTIGHSWPIHHSRQTLISDNYFVGYGR